MHRFAVPAALIAALSLAPLADAGLVDVGTFSYYNVITLQNFTGTNSDVEGTLAVGGAGSFTNYGLGQKLNSSANGKDTVVVGGAMTSSNANVFFGDVRAGSSSGSLSVPNGVVRTTGLPNFNDAATYGANASTYLSGLTTNGTTTFGNSNTLVTLAGADSSLNVFTIAGNLLSGVNTFQLNIPTSSTAIINVTGASSGLQNAGYFINGAQPSYGSGAGAKVLFNFSSASTLTFSGIGIFGSILAPNAAVNFANGQINGDLLVKSFSGGGQLNLNPYTGIDVSPVP